MKSQDTYTLTGRVIFREETNYLLFRRVRLQILLDQDHEYHRANEKMKETWASKELSSWTPFKSQRSAVIEPCVNHLPKPGEELRDARVGEQVMLEFYVVDPYYLFANNLSASRCWGLSDTALERG